MMANGLIRSAQGFVAGLKKSLKLMPDLALRGYPFWSASVKAVNDFVAHQRNQHLLS